MEVNTNRTSFLHKSLTELDGNETNKIIQIAKDSCRVYDLNLLRH